MFFCLVFFNDDQAPDSELNMFDPFMASQINTILGYNKIHRYKTNKAYHRQLTLIVIFEKLR